MNFEKIIEKINDSNKFSLSTKKMYKTKFNVFEKNNITF